MEEELSSALGLPPFRTTQSHWRPCDGLEEQTVENVEKIEAVEKEEALFLTRMGRPWKGKKSIT